MGKKELYHYYVEGEDEKKLLNVLKRDIGCVESGKVDKLNVVQTKITVARVRTLKPDTIVVLIYDTDVEDGLAILRQNVDFLNKQKGIKQVICIPQVKNLEEELLHACNIKKITELTKSDSIANYKRDFINCNNLATRLKECGFDINKLWNRVPTNKFERFGNEAEKIKI